MTRSASYALLADVGAIVLFVAIGRRSHDETGNAVVGAVKVAAPFLIALAVAWLAARAWLQPTSLRSGALIWLITVALGMVIRNLLFDSGTATAFVIVATLTLAIFLQGWRSAWRWRQNR